MREYFAFAGRLQRRGFVLFYGLPYLVVGALPGLLLPHGPLQVTLESLVVLVVLPGIARRLHDVGIGLWIFLVVEAVYFGVLGLQTTGVLGEWRQLVILLASAPSLLIILALFFIPGTKDSNRFGAPVGSDQQAA